MNCITYYVINYIITYVIDYLHIKGMRQYATSPDNSPYLSPQETTNLQSVVGSFLYYVRVVDPTILMALNEIAS